MPSAVPDRPHWSGRRNPAMFLVVGMGLSARAALKGSGARQLDVNLQTGSVVVALHPNIDRVAVDLHMPSDDLQDVALQQWQEILRGGVHSLMCQQNLQALLGSPRRLGLSRPELEAEDAHADLLNSR
jgi:hypothetical protein